MSRRNKKASHDDHIDRISDLPSDVINGILEHLPIHDMVRTSILSKKWRYAWASVQRLEFENKFFEKCKDLEEHEISRIITEVLLLHDGPIYKFTLLIPFDYKIRYECLNKWILFLSSNGLRDLELVNQRTDPYQFPSHLFSCQQLTYLELHNFVLSAPPDFFSFKILVELHLYDIKLDSSALESLISVSPFLEVLTLSFCYGFECFKISAPSLNTLYIEGDRAFKSICFEKAKNLVDVSIMVNRPGWSLRASDLIKGLPKIERLSLGAGYIKILSALKIPQMLQRSFNCLKYVELDGTNFVTTEFSFIVCLLESSPNLEELVIKCYNNIMVRSNFKEKGNNYCFDKLRTVNITVKNAYEDALTLIRFLLANCSSLEILTLKVGLGLKDAAILLKISSELLGMERASQKAEVKFLYDTLHDGAE